MRWLNRRLRTRATVSPFHDGMSMPRSQGEQVTSWRSVHFGNLAVPPKVSGNHECRMETRGEKSMEQLRAFGNWIPLARLCVAEMPRYGAISGVYAMRSTGTGEILYIGSTSSLRRRVLGSRTVDQGGEICSALDTSLLPPVCGQPGKAVTLHPGLQPVLPRKD